MRKRNQLSHASELFFKCLLNFKFGNFRSQRMRKITTGSGNNFFPLHSMENFLHETKNNSLRNDTKIQLKWFFSYIRLFFHSRIKKNVSISGGKHKVVCGIETFSRSLWWWWLSIRKLKIKTTFLVDEDQHEKWDCRTFLDYKILCHRKHYHREKDHIHRVKVADNIRCIQVESSTMLWWIKLNCCFRAIILLLSHVDTVENEINVEMG